MTRWHDDDLAGRLLKTEPQEWTVLSIPAICEREHDGTFRSERKVGDALWPSHHDINKLNKQRERAPREFNALYQQHPVIEGGNIVKRDWFQTISLAEFTALRFNEPMHFYLDTAYGKKKPTSDNDPSGILAACRIGKNIYLYNAQRVWKEMPDLLRFLPDYIAAHGGDSESKLHVEPKANGAHRHRPTAKRHVCVSCHLALSAVVCLSCKARGMMTFSMKCAVSLLCRTMSSLTFSAML